MALKYSFNKNNEFVIEDYDKAKTFASFLPGIAGIDGIPMWSFYVNRGQCLGSFGVRDKDSTIMEFFPANTMYKNIELQGFRTFIKYRNEIHEIFSSMSRDIVDRRMIIEENILKIEEINKTLDIKVVVTYFTMPKESFAAIVRKVQIENLSEEEKEIEVLDGLTQILPYGAKNNEYQAMSNLLRAWFDVHNLNNKIPYYVLRAATDDSAEIGQISGGNFYISFSDRSSELIKPIVDMDVIFGSNTSLTWPEGWNCNFEEFVNRKQVVQNKASGGFTPLKSVLKDKMSICTIIGHASSLDTISERKDNFNFEYVNKKEQEARELVELLSEDTATKTSSHLFDKYIDQCYLDNILRGGYPLIFKAGDKNYVYHVYSRKHGDLEREYNFFSIEPAYYSQGNGNFRDVNQNRRNDVLFKPQVKDFNVKQFMNLIQADGYNPLSVKGSTFTLNKNEIDKILNLVSSSKEGFKKIISGKFTPGQIITYITDNHVEISVSKEELLYKILESSEQDYEAEFGEGYWVDHWTYNMDLIESYLNVYPDELEHFAFEDCSYRFFDSPVRVLSRADKYVLVDGKVRQYGAILEDKEKCSRLGINAKSTNWLKTQNGLGKIYETNVYVKLVSLALNKFVNLDSLGMGIEMEAGKPGWNDAMNGLPGIFGSGIGETAELKRIVDFIIKLSSEFDKKIAIPCEMCKLLKKVYELLSDNLEGKLEDFNYWDETSNLKESYREEIRFGIDGKEEVLTTKEILSIFKKFNEKLNRGLERSLDYGNGVYPTYITYEASKYEVLDGKTNPVNGYQNVRVKEFRCNPLPLFLEGPARTLKIIKNREKAEKMYAAVKKSPIYDNKLKMYKTSVSIEELSNEIGRARAFTAGWLEREAIFLHMEYKYLLAMLKSGLYDEYFNDIKTTLVPFLDPEMYGRSTLENSSFIASSVNPDENVHGRGFVARLSGSTAEMLSMWSIMMAGQEPFIFEKGELKFRLKPIIPGWLFDEKGKVSFKFLGNTEVIYHNPKKQKTYGTDSVAVKKIVLSMTGGKRINIDGDVIGEPFSKNVRNGEVTSIEVYFI